MTDCKRFKNINWKIALLVVIGVALLTSLGFWQLARARQKQLLIDSFSARSQHAPLSAASVNFKNDLRYYRIELSGKFDTQHSLLLDNKIVGGNIGYEVYTPFYARGLSQVILVDRGFIPLGPSRAHLPSLKEISGEVKISGMLNTPPRYVSLGAMQADVEAKWPLRVEYINMDQVWGKGKFYPYIVELAPSDPAAYEIKWQAIVTMPPERHIAYAVQWFALALTLLLLSLALNRKSGELKRD